MRRGTAAHVVVGFAAGAGALVAFSVLQKLMMGVGAAVLLSPRAYVVPVLFGGAAGAALGWYHGRVRASEARFRLLSEFAAELVFWRGPDGRLVYISPSCERVTGYGARELLDDPALLSSIVHPEDVALHHDHVHRARGDGTLDPIHFRIVRKDGEVRWVSHVCTPIHDRDGRWLGVRGSHADVTEARRLEERVRRGQRRELLAELAAGFAHDVRNVLAAVIAPAELLRESARDAATAELAGEIASASRQAADLARKLLSLGREAPAALRPANLQDVVRAALPLLRRAAGERATIRLDADLEPLRVHADPAQLEQVLLNLVVNAREAMLPAGGTITVAVRRGARADEERAGAPGPCATLSVADEGPGVDPALRERIFEPFLTTRAEAGGTGLGLAIVDRIVRDHRGAVHVEGAPGSGARFVVTLPLAAATDAPLPARAASGR